MNATLPTISGHAVIIAGAGPTGLMLAGELALANVDVAVVEPRANRELAGMRALGLHARTIEMLDQRGIVERFLAAGRTAQLAGFAGVSLDISDFPTRHNHGLALPQIHVERLLGDWIDELKVPVYRGRAISGFTQDEAGVDIELSDTERTRAQYLVGCDGGRSVVRRAAGIPFRGCDPTTSNLLAEAQLAAEPEWGIRRDAIGIHAFSKLDDSGRVRVMITERQVVPNGEPTLRELSEGLIAVYGSDYGIHSPTLISRFTDMTRQAAAYRDRRVFVAGDAAHVHPPDGGHGLQTGVQDAVNLGWKLAQVISGTSPDSLLDTYHAERHPVAARVLKYTMASVALRREDDRMKALRETLAELLCLDEPRRHFAAAMSGLDIRYDFGVGHPLLGRRVPDLDLVTADGPRRVFTFLHDARPVLLNLGTPSEIDITPWAARVKLIEAKCSGPWELPAIGRVAAPTAVLIRPDGYVAWVGENTGLGLVEALTQWFGVASR